jgi:hypothetical protein
MSGIALPLPPLAEANSDEVREVTEKAPASNFKFFRRNLLSRAFVKLSIYHVVAAPIFQTCIMEQYGLWRMKLSAVGA